jgi:hypothetical protein
VHGNYSNSIHGSVHGNGMVSQHGSGKMIDNMNQMMTSGGSPTKGMHDMASAEVSGHSRSEVSGHGWSAGEVSGHGRA